MVIEPSAASLLSRKAPRIGGRPTTIASLATYVPPRVLTNADLEKMVETTDEWILQRTGIRERHIVDAGVAASDLGSEAAISEEKDAIEDIYEPFLIQIGFLDRTPRGRVATPLAYGYFGLVAPDERRRDSRLW